MHIYTDGTVLVTHGGVEMGQGLHTKVAQVAAQALGIPLTDVFIAETATDKVANASPTAASASSDLYGSAGGHPAHRSRLQHLTLQLCQPSCGCCKHSACCLAQTRYPETACVCGAQALAGQLASGGVAAIVAQIKLWPAEFKWNSHNVLD